MAKNKKAKIVDLSPKGKKITEQELTDLQKVAKSFEDHYRELGVMEIRKHALAHSVQALQASMNEMQVKLKETYGNIDIDISNGDIKETTSAEADS